MRGIKTIRYVGPPATECPVCEGFHPQLSVTDCALDNGKTLHRCRRCGTRYIAAHGEAECNAAHAARKTTIPLRHNGIEGIE